ncbi:MAG: hypothetical protein J6Y17_04045 [Elusimicrobiaceae bacterium]|nr:hypothetical protein [Elusimicrobiaceae bacterium]
MKKGLLPILIVALCLTATSAFAQFKLPLKTATNWANLERVVARNMQGPLVGQRWAKVPTSVVQSGRIVLSPSRFPQEITPVSRVWRQYLVNLYGTGFPNVQKVAQIASYTDLPLVVENWQGLAFYTNQSALAQDLHKFYKGKGDIRVSPTGREVILYALPVDGILYKPSKYTFPLVLNPNQYFVIYDVKAKTGKIAENKPEVYNLFKPTQEFEQVDDGLKFPSNATPRQRYQINRDFYTNNPLVSAIWEKRDYPSHFTDLDKLAKVLHDLYRGGVYRPRVKDINTGIFYEVLELPKPVVLNGEIQPQSFVILYSSHPGGVLMGRKQLEDPEHFEFIR